MKKLLVALGISSVVFLSHVPVIADDAVQLKGVEKPKIELPKQDYKKTDTLLTEDDEILNQIVKLQREKDLEDIDNLWKGTV